MVYVQPAPMRPRQARVDKLARPEKPRLTSRRPSEQAPQDTQPETLEAAAPHGMNAPPADNPAETPARLDIDELKELARRDMDRQGRIQPGHAGQEALERAWRPKCDNNYKPRIGSVEFSGLMKLPFLLKGALSDNGCK